MAAPNMTAPMSVDSDTMKSQYCLLFWYDGERNWSIQSSLTIFAPRKDVYQPGELVKAKFTGKLYRAAIVRTEESKEVLKEEAAKFEELLKDESLSANLVLQKMGLEVDLGSSKKDPVSIRKKSEKRTRPDVNLDSKGTKGDHAVPEGGDVVQNAVAEDDHAISAGVKRARLLFGSTEESVSTTAKTVSLTASTLEEVTVSKGSVLKGSQENMDTSQHSRPPCRHCRNKCRYYKLDNTDQDIINKFLSGLVEKAIMELECSYCLQIGEDNRSIAPLTLGRISSYYYLKHNTVRMFCDELKAESSLPDLIEVLSNAHEYAELPVRHNEDQINSDLAQKVPLQVNPHSYDSAHTKTNILLQAHFSQLQLPSSDYNTDTKSVLDQAIRVLQAMLDVSADQGWLATSLRVIQLIQMVIQGRWLSDSTLLTLPHIMPYHVYCFRPQMGGARKKGFPELRGPIETLPELMAVCDGRFEALAAMLEGEMNRTQIDQVYRVLCCLPQIDVHLKLKGFWEGSHGQEEHRPVNLTHAGGRRPDSVWIPVHADQEYVLQVELHRANKTRKNDSKASTPRFPKPKDEGWMLVVGEVETKELIALKRVGYIRGRSKVQLALFTPETVGRVIYTLYLMSDAYLGLDQQYDICLDVKPPSIETQVNTELKDELDALDFGD